MPFPAKVSRQSSRWKLVLCIDDDKNALHPRKLVLEAAGDDMTQPPATGSRYDSSNGSSPKGTRLRCCCDV